jgi:hypothetical protein
MANLIVEIANRHYKHVKRRVRDARRLRSAQVVLISAPKSGRTWVRTLLSRLYQRRHDLPERELLDFDNFRRADPAIPAILFSHEAGLLAVADADGPARAALGEKKIVLLARNPIDVGVSRYFHIVHRAQDDRKRRVRELSMFEFMLADEFGLPAIVGWMNGWWRQVRRLPARHLMHYETLRAAPAETLTALLRFLEQSFSAEEIAEAVEFARFENLAKREAEGFFAGRRLAAADAGNRDSFKVRRGKVGGYREYFDAEQCERLESWVARHLDRELAAPRSHASDVPAPQLRITS